MLLLICYGIVEREAKLGQIKCDACHLQLAITGRMPRTVLQRRSPLDAYLVYFYGPLALVKAPNDNSVYKSTHSGAGGVFGGS